MSKPTVEFLCGLHSNTEKTDIRTKVIKLLKNILTHSPDSTEIWNALRWDFETEQRNKSNNIKNFKFT